MISTRRRLAASVSAALLLSALPAAAAPPPVVGGGAADRLLGQVERLDAPGRATVGAAVVDGRLRTTPQSATDALLSVRDHRDQRVWLGAIAATVAQTAGLEAVGAAAALDHDEDSFDDGFSLTGSVASVLGVGDLDGDGRDDVLAADYDLETGTARLRAVSGDDGSAIWSQPFGTGGLAFPAGADLTGDGVEDLIRLGLTIHEDDFTFEESRGLLSSRYEERYRAAYTWDVGVVSGATGDVAWSEDVEGELDERYVEESSLTAYRASFDLTGTNLDVFPLLLDTEVAVSALDADVAASYRDEGTALGGEESFTYRVRTATDLSVRDSGGAVTRRLVEEPYAGVTIYSGLADATGDDALLRQRYDIGDEEVRCSYGLTASGGCTGGAAEGGAEIARLDGATFDEVWVRSGDHPFRDASIVEDLDGDGVADVLDLDVDLESFALLTTLVDGATGEARWTMRGDDWGFPISTGDYDGAGGGDLLLAASEFGESIVIRLDRVDGATGAVLASSRFEGPALDEGDAPEPGPGPLDLEDPLGLRDLLGGGDGPCCDFSFSFLLLGVAAPGDLDGDDRDDVAGSAFSYAGTFRDGDVFEETSWEARLERGVDAAVLHAEGGEGFGFLFPLADVDGDGVTDLERLVEESDGDMWRYRTDVVAWPSLAVRWAVEDGYLLDGGDHDGAPGSELLHVVDDWDDEEVSTTFASREGLTGATRWLLAADRDA
jgi:hypothetical protein